MKIYNPNHRQGRHLIFIQPGKQFPISDWLDEKGQAKLIEVSFQHGVSDVADNIGQYLIEQGLARRSPLLLPEDV